MEPYREAHKIKLKDQNMQNWWLGRYIHDAVSISISNAFRDKGKKAIEYPKEPYRIFEPTEAEKEQAAEIERQKAIAFFTQLEKKFNRDKKPGAEGGDDSAKH